MFGLFQRETNFNTAGSRCLFGFVGAWLVSLRAVCGTPTPVCAPSTWESGEGSKSVPAGRHRPITSCHFLRMVCINGVRPSRHSPQGCCEGDSLPDAEHSYSIVLVFGDSLSPSKTQLSSLACRPGVGGAAPLTKKTLGRQSPKGNTSNNEARGPGLPVTHQRHHGGDIYLLWSEQNAKGRSGG